MNMKTVQNLEAKGKKVLVRVDWNVTLGKALQIVDDTRIKRTEKTIKWLVQYGAEKVILMSHLGKPQGNVDERLSIKPVAEYASKLMNLDIKVEDTIEGCKSNNAQIVMLENLRFWSGEQENNQEFAEQLSDMGDVYVNEAFGESHREVASIVGIVEILPAYAGFNLIEEVKEISQAVDDPDRPLVIIMGGAKVEDKLKILEAMSKKADTLLLGGKLANEFLDQNIKLKGWAKVITPVEGSDLMDIGQDTRRLFRDKILWAGTIVWNGPMGMVESQEYKAGTHAVYEAIIENRGANVVVGGGDTLAAIREEKHLKRIDWVSTGGGAMLKLIEKGTLPGIEKLIVRK